MSWRGLHSVGTSDRQRAMRNADDAVSLAIRSRDRDLPCILTEANHCNPKNERQCGHFIARESEATRYHPWNLNAECAACNSSHVSGYRPDKGFPYGLAIDAKYGKGTALFLYRLAHPLHVPNQIQPQEGWTTDELILIKDSARKGYPVLEAIYRQLRPHHFPLTKQPKD